MYITLAQYSHKIENITHIQTFFTAQCYDFMSIYYYIYTVYGNFQTVRINGIIWYQYKNDSKK